MKIKRSVYKWISIFAISLTILSGCNDQNNANNRDKKLESNSVSDVKKLDESSNKKDNKYVEGDFSLWSDDSKTVESIKDYVKDITNSDSKNFIPIEDRIAVFDMDGTLYGELAPIYIEWWMYAYRVLDDPNFKADDEMKLVGEKIKKAGESREIPDELEKEHSLQNARAFAGMSVDEYKDYVREFLKKDAVGFKNLTYQDATYKPMIQLVNFLEDNDFKVYICSGTDRDLCRIVGEETFNIPYDQVIGMDVLLEGKDQDGEDGLEYEMKDDEEVVRSDKLLIKNVKMNKVSQIAQEIGKKPVLSFGNSSGDTSMGKFVTDSNPYRAQSYMLIADDDKRDYGDPQKAKEKAKNWKDLDWNVVSMKNEFKTIYGNKVEKDK